jgi:thiamine biosynthesis protein ThiS
MRNSIIQLNGKEKELPSTPITIAQLLEELKLNPQTVVCELNLKIIKRADYPATTLSEGDQLEILQMMGGG